ncbi:MAG: hypothetical protein ABSG68_05520 [Thermoguttaceae bacterium]|jgi:hypothetical protein
MNDLLQRVQEALTGLPGGALPWLGGLALLSVLWLAWRRLRQQKKRPRGLQPSLTVDIAALGERGPPAGPPTLEFYNLPVRLAAIVLAPAGRVRELPPPNALPDLLCAILPGLDVIAAMHETEVRRWPNQLSASGFAHILFANARLPGDGGKGTPWSTVAGTIRLQGQPLMAGLILRARTANNFGQVVVEREEQWLACLRVTGLE